MSATPNRLPLFIILGVLVALAATAALLFKGSGEKTEEGTQTQAASRTPDSTERPVEQGRDRQGEPEKGPERSTAVAAANITKPVERPLPPSFQAALSGLSGRVVEPDGSPVKGARVELLGGMADFLGADALQLLFEPEAFDPKIELQAFTTREDGRFQFTRVDPRLFHVIGVNLGAARPYVRFVDRTPNAGESVDLGDLVLDPPLRFTGRVVTKSGSKPIAGARVLATTIPFAAFTAGIANVHRDMNLLVNEGSGREFVWRFPVWARNLYDKLPFPKATTAADGTFTIEGVPSGEITVLVQTKGRPPSIQRVTASKNPQKDIGEITVDDGKEAFGMVVTDDNKPVAGAELMVGVPCPLAKDNVAFLVDSATSDAKGNFSFSGLGSDEVILVGRAPGVRGWTISKPMQLAGDELVLKLPVSFSVVVTASDEQGKPAAVQKFAIVSTQNGPQSVPQLAPQEPVKSVQIEPGQYRIPGVLKGKHKLVAWTPGFALETRDFEINDSDAEVKLTMQRGREIKVTVTGPENGTLKPVESAHVFCIPSRDENLGFAAVGGARTGPDGVVTVRAPKKGKCMLQVSHPGYAMFFEKIENPDVNEKSVQMLVGGTIDGTATLGAKAPQPPRLILLSRKGYTPDLVEFPRMALTDADGKFKFTHIAPGEFTVEPSPFRFGDRNLATMGSSIEELFELPFFEERARAETTVVDERVTEVHLDLDPKQREATAEDARIYGRITKNGQPMANATIVIFGGEYRRTKTDAAGHYDSGPVKASDWMNVSIENSRQQGWGEMASRGVKLKPGDSKEVNFDIKTAGPVRGIVKSAVTGATVSGAQVQAHRVQPPNPGNVGEEEEHSWSNIGRMTGANGEFEINEIPEGQYVFEARGSGHGKAKTGIISITAGSVPAPIEILLPRGLEVSGKVSFDGSAKVDWSGLYFVKLDDKEPSAEWVQVKDSQFTTDVLTPGKYRVELQCWSNDGGTDSGEGEMHMLQFESQELTIGAAGHRDLLLTFVKKKQVSQPTPGEK